MSDVNTNKPVSGGGAAPPLTIPPPVVAFIGMPSDPVTGVGAAVANAFAFFCTPVGQTVAKHIYDQGMEMEKWLEGTLGKVGDFFEDIAK
jgi:hypothetical protein